MLMEKIVLGLGSNVGNSLQYLRNAVKEISKFTENLKVSSVYKTKPQDYLAQADFLNLVLVANYHDNAENLLKQTKKIEKNNGRNKTNQIEKGPRTLDIDILLFGKKIINTKNLIIPHPRIKNRQFVLIPLLEVFPNSADPITEIPYSFFQKKLENQGVKKYCSLFENKENL